jgi:hypothetical protein
MAKLPQTILDGVIQQVTLIKNMLTGMEIFLCFTVLPAVYVGAMAYIDLK